MNAMLIKVLLNVTLLNVSLLSAVLLNGMASHFVLCKFNEACLTLQSKLGLNKSKREVQPKSDLQQSSCVWLFHQAALQQTPRSFSGPPHLSSSLAAALAEPSQFYSSWLAPDSGLLVVVVSL